MFRLVTSHLKASYNHLSKYTMACVHLTEVNIGTTFHCFDFYVLARVIKFYPITGLVALKGR
jgi:hypothetical protein